MISAPSQSALQDSTHLLLGGLGDIGQQLVGGLQWKRVGEEGGVNLGSRVMGNAKFYSKL